MTRVLVAATCCVALAISSGDAPALSSRQTSPSSGGPTFTRDVAPVFYKNCVGCHRPGEIAPMSLITYQNIRPWVKAIQERVVDRLMPPWHTDPRYGRFLNDRRLSQRDIDTILAWIKNGAAEGNPADLPPLPKFPEGWTIGVPDLVVSMPSDFDVPARGVIPYQHFEVPTRLAEDKWIQTVEIRPSNRAVVHHIVVYSREPGPSTRLAPWRGRQDQSLASHAAFGVPLTIAATGTNALVLRPGGAMRIKAGSVLTFQVHYTANGTAAKDRTSIGMVFAKTPPQIEVRSDSFINSEFVIPAGAPNHRVDSEIEFTDDVQIWGLGPHAHFRGKSWEYRLNYPDGRAETVLAVPRYDYNWQTYYFFENPLRAPKGSKLLATAYFDNSKNNRANPDPSVNVRWGEQSWDEMQYTAIAYSVGKASSGSGAAK